MRAMVGLLFALGWFIGSSREAAAWGDLGHKIVCQIAFEQLSEPVKKRVNALIKSDAQFASFSESCVWPDHPRKRPSEHFLNLARDASGTTANHPCGASQKCVVTAINADLAVLESHATAAKKLQSPQVSWPLGR